LRYLSDLKMTTRVALAKHPKILMRIVALLGSGVGNASEKSTKLAALVLSNINVAPASRTYMMAFERDILLVAATDPGVSKILGNILSEFNYDEDEKI